MHLPDSVGILVVATLATTSSCASLGPSGPGTSGNQAVRVYASITYAFTAEHTYRTWYTLWLWKRTEPDPTIRRQECPCGGSAFLVRSPDNYYLVTAAHVAYGPKDIQTINGDKVTDMKLVESTVKVGGLSLLMDKPCTRDDDRDIVLYVISRQQVELLNAHVFGAESIVAPHGCGDDVTAWGFPRTTDCQLKKAQISSIGANYFALNIPLEPGFSGGPVRDSVGKLVGVILRSDDKQTRCLLATELLKIIR